MMELINLIFKMAIDARDVKWFEVLFQIVGPENLILNLHMLGAIHGNWFLFLALDLVLCSCTFELNKK